MIFQNYMTFFYSVESKITPTAYNVVAIYCLVVNVEDNT